MNVVYLGLGSNLDIPVEQLRMARKAISATKGITERAFSSLYRNPPMGGAHNQPDYVNAVMKIETMLSPFELLAETQRIENEQGRVRVQRWGSRTLDIDILMFGDEVLDTPELVVPHYGMAERSFVLQPLFEIAPDLEIPNLGKLTNWLARCSLDNLERLTDAA